MQKMIKPIIIIIFNSNYYWFKSIAIDLQLRQKRSEQILKYLFQNITKILTDYSEFVKILVWDNRLQVWSEVVLIRKKGSIRVRFFSSSIKVILIGNRRIGMIDKPPWNSNLDKAKLNIAGQYINLCKLNNTKTMLLKDFSFIITDYFLSSPLYSQQKK